MSAFFAQSPDLIRMKKTGNILKPETLALYEHIKAEMLKRYGFVHDIPGETGFSFWWFRKSGGRKVEIRVFIAKSNGIMKFEFTRSMIAGLYVKTELKHFDGSDGSSGTHPTFIDVKIDGLPVMMMTNYPETSFVCAKFAVKDVEEYNLSACRQYSMGLLEKLLQV